MEFCLKLRSISIPNSIPKFFSNRKICTMCCISRQGILADKVARSRVLENFPKNIFENFLRYFLKIAPPHTPQLYLQKPRIFKIIKQTTSNFLKKNSCKKLKKIFFEKKRKEFSKKNLSEKKFV